MQPVNYIIFYSFDILCLTSINGVHVRSAVFSLGAQNVENVKKLLC